MPSLSTTLLLLFAVLFRLFVYTMPARLGWFTACDRLMWWLVINSIDLLPLCYSRYDSFVIDMIHPTCTSLLAVVVSNNIVHVIHWMVALVPCVHCVCHLPDIVLIIITHSSLLLATQWSDSTDISTVLPRLLCFIIIIILLLWWLLLLLTALIHNIHIITLRVGIGGYHLTIHHASTTH